MKRITKMVPGLLAAFALSALVVPSALATPPAPEYGKCLKKALAGGEGFSDAGCTKHVSSAAKYEWDKGGANGMTFTSHIKPETKATLETRKKEKVVCTGETGTGKVLSEKEVETTPTFTGCETLTKKCSTTGQAEGTIAVSALQGEIGVEKVFINSTTHLEEPAKNKLANSLYRQGNRGGEIVNFLCSGFEIKVKGTVLFPLTSNKMLKVATVKFAQSGGKQKPEKFVEGGTEVLESKFGGGIFEQSGQTIAVIQENAEAAEASSVN